MSDPSVSRSGEDLEESGSRLVRQINAAMSQQDVENILAEISELMRRNPSLDQKQSLKRYRQRAYDRRRKLQTTTTEEEPAMVTGNNLLEFPSIGELQRSQHEVLDEVRNLRHRVEQLAEDVAAIRTEVPAPEYEQASESNGTKTHAKQDFLTGAFSQLAKLNGEAFARHFPLALILTAIAGIIGWFVADQITPLYQAFKFDRPELVAWGSIGMAVGFSGIYGAMRSRPAAFMCGLILIYEVLFVVAGTRSHEQVQQATEADAVPEIAFARAELDKAKGEYERNKARYDDSEDKVHQNTWFKSNYIDPAWSTYAEKQAGYTSLRTQYLEDNGGFGLQGLLKLFYRVCAVILLMIVTGLAIRKIRDSIAFQS